MAPRTNHRNEAMQNEQTSFRTLSTLPSEVCLHILSFLDFSDLLNMGQTSRYWRHMCNNEKLWREKCLQDFHMDLNSDLLKRPLFWKSEYRLRKKLEKRWRSGRLPQVRMFHGHFGDHFNLFNSDRVCVRSQFQSIAVYNARNGQLLRFLEGHQKAIICTHITDTLLITGSGDATVRVWQLADGKCLHVLRGHYNIVTTLHLENHLLVTGSADRSVRLWNVRTGRCLRVIHEAFDRIQKVAINGNHIVAVMRSARVKVWNIDKGDPIAKYRDDASEAIHLFFDGTNVSVVYNKEVVTRNIWKRSKILHKFPLNNKNCVSVKDKYMVTGYEAGLVVHQYPSGRKIFSLREPRHESFVRCLDINSLYVVSAHVDESIKLFSIHTARVVAIIAPRVQLTPRVIRVDDTRILCGFGDVSDYIYSTLVIYDFLDREPEKLPERRRTKSF